jgi:hypothetical protein
MSQAQVTPEEAYYVVLRTVVAGNQANWVSCRRMLRPLLLSLTGQPVVPVQTTADAAVVIH